MEYDTQSSARTLEQCSEKSSSSLGINSCAARWNALERSADSPLGCIATSSTAQAPSDVLRKRSRESLEIEQQVVR
eukprot:3091912-Amphidinium_carterae.1